MKKLLILFLVFAMTSMVSALTVSLSLDGSNAMGTTMDVLEEDLGEAISLSIISDTAGVDGTYYSLVKMARDSLTKPATVSNFVKTTKAGDMGSVDDYTTSSLYKISIFAGGNVTFPQVGVQFTFDLTPSTDLNVGDTFSFWTTVPNDDNAPPDHVVTVTIVPEPMTILLLGIGGLFLRRRK